MYELQAGDFGYRRKRNLNLNESGTIGDLTKRPSITSTGIHWPGEGTSSTEELCSCNIGNSEPDEINDEQAPLESANEIEENETLQGKASFITPTRPSLTPQPIGQKLTIYLSPDMVVKVKNLKRQHCIPSISWLVGEAIQDYLTANGGESENNR